MFDASIHLDYFTEPFVSAHGRTSNVELFLKAISFIIATYVVFIYKTGICTIVV